jgi:HD-like signal output (HDOD) protein
MSETHYRSLESFKNQLDLHNLPMPTLPDVALRAQKLAADPNSTPEQLASVISSDAALSAQIIRVANSPLMRHLSEVRSIAQAVMRLGFNTVKDLSLVFAMKNAAKVRSSFANAELKASWEESREIAAIASAIAVVTKKLPADQALLAGMIHRIGVLPLVSAMDELRIEPEEAKGAREAIEELHPELGSQILRHWRFAEDLACIPESYKDPCRPGGKRASPADTVAIAYLVYRVSKGGVEWIPPLNSLESGIRLDLDCSVEALKAFASNEQVQQSRSLLA